jgi:hypothetical protein
MDYYIGTSGYWGAHYKCVVLAVDEEAALETFVKYLEHTFNMRDFPPSFVKEAEVKLVENNCGVIDLGWIA